MARWVLAVAAIAVTARAFDVASVTPEMLLRAADPNQQSARSCLPYLAVGTHGGICPGLTGEEPALKPLLEQVYSAPVFGTPGVLQAEFPWAALEPQPESYNFDPVHEQLGIAKELGLSLVVSIPTLDSDLVSVPPDFAGTDPTKLRQGLHWNSTSVMERFLVLLSKAMPVISQYGNVAHVSLGKEVDVNLLQNPSTLTEWAQLAATAQYLGRNASFFSEYTSVGFSLSFNGLMEVAGTELLPVLLSIADSTPITYYPRIGDTEVVADPDVVQRDMTRFEAAMPDSRCLSISNIGYPSGYNNASSVDNSTFAKQAAFYEQAVAGIRQANSTRSGPFGQPRFKAISFTNLADLPDAACIEYAKYLHKTSAGFLENVCTIGIVDQAGKPKPAFEAFLRALKH